MLALNAVVLDAVRTPIGASVGALKRWHAVDLLAAVLADLVDRTRLDPLAIDHVIGGCATPVGEQALNVTRNAVLAAGWPESIPAHTIDAHASSSMLALHEAVALVSAGMAKVCVVVGVESTRVPEGASTGTAVGKPFGPLLHDRYAEMGGLVAPGPVGDRLALRHGLTRAELDAYAVVSRERAQIAQHESRQKAEISALVETGKKPLTVVQDELRGPIDVEQLRPLFENEGLLTAATFAMPADAAVAVVVAHPAALKKSQRPLASIDAALAIGGDVLNGSSGAELVQRLCRATALEPRDLDRIEVREDSAATPLALSHELAIDLARLNSNGGALASGDPLGASGLLTVTSLVHGLAREQQQRGLGVVAGAAAVTSGVLVTNLA